MASNPFHDLYLSEAISEEQLVELFSPIIVEHSGVVFEAGNVIVRGLQGTGKTMLLNLLRPDLRLAYKRAGIEFPVRGKSARFIGAGINLRKCGALEFAQHLERDMDPRRVQDLALLFADFVNYWIVDDLLTTVKQFLEINDSDLSRDVGLSGKGGYIEAFATALAADPCWFGALDGARSLPQLMEKIAERISVYRKFLNLNIEQIPEWIKETKTVIGDPILKCADALKSSKLLHAEANVFVRVDQYEQLDTLNIVGTEYGASCKQLIHKALAARDGRVSYRIGTRTHGWQERPAIYRTTDVLERKRDYDIVDMDEIFRRRENSRTWLFPEFAADIFARRMKVSEYSNRRGAAGLTLRAIFGRSLPPGQKANRYVSTNDGRVEVVRKAVSRLPAEVSMGWKSYVLKLAERDLLSAWLACAWVRQKIVPRKNAAPLGVPPGEDEVPWLSKPYWFKERVQLALMQIASANRQALLWTGEDDVVNLGGGQILVFLFLLQHIWDAWLRDQRGDYSTDLQFPIRFEVQSQGVLEASIEWRDKQIEGLNAQQRKIFVDALGEHFYVALTDDRAMSYPGANGFSLENNELDQNPDIKRFLKEAAGFGDLYESSHTSKKKGERRTKYYLAPILSPYFRIPSVHTKEPEYITTQQVRRWMTETSRDVTSSSIPAQPMLWDEAADD